MKVWGSGDRWGTPCIAGERIAGELEGVFQRAARPCGVGFETGNWELHARNQVTGIENAWPDASPASIRNRMNLFVPASAQTRLLEKRVLLPGAGTVDILPEPKSSPFKA